MKFLYLDVLAEKAAKGFDRALSSHLNVAFSAVDVSHLQLIG